MATVCPAVIVSHAVLVIVSSICSFMMWFFWSRTVLPLEVFTCTEEVFDNMSLFMAEYKCIQPYAVTTRLLYTSFQPVTFITILTTLLEILEFSAAVLFAAVQGKSGGFRVVDAVFGAYRLSPYADFKAVMNVIRLNCQDYTMM